MSPRGEETRRRICFSQFPSFARRYVCVGEVRCHKGHRSHKGRHEGFTFFSNQEHHKGELGSPLQVLFKVARPLHKVEATPQQGGSQLHHEARQLLQPPQCLQQGEFPQQETLYKENPHQGDSQQGSPPRRSRVTRFPYGNCFNSKSLRWKGRSAPPLQDSWRNHQDIEQGGRSTKF